MVAHQVGIHNMDYLAFVVSIISIAALLVLYTKHKGGSIGKGAWGGIKAFVLFGIVVGGVAQCVKAGELEWFQYGEVYLGIDAPFSGTSPQCEVGPENGDNDKVTSNGGIRVNGVRYGGFELNGYYLHKSCAISQDDLVYDAAGIEAVYQLWSR